MKRAMALLLAAVLLSLLAGCSWEVPQTTTEAPTTQPVTETTVPRPTPGYVAEPVTVEFWYNYSYVSGQNELLLEQVARFNEINPYGITVKAVEHSDYTAIYDSLSKGKPDLVCGAMYTAVQMDADGRIADMADYVRRDGWDLENFPASLRGYMQHYEDKVICFPYNVSTYVLYYNKAYCPEPPESLEQWVEMARKITEENPKVHGMYLPISFTTLQRPILESLGASGVVNEAGDGPGDNLFGTLQTFCTDWLNWMEEGFCSPISTNADDHMIAFFSGHCAAYPASSGRLADAQAYCGHYGTEFGVAPMVGYGGYSTSVSMGMLVPLDNGNQQKTAATWEFIKFLYADEQVVEFAVETGYLPMTCSAAKHPDMLAYWEENPYAKVGFDQLEHATSPEWSEYWSQWLQEIDMRIAMVIGERTMLPDEAVDDLRREAAQIFP